MSVARTGKGTTVTFGTSAWSADLLEVSGPEQSREAIDTTHLGSSDDNKSYIPDDFAEPGTIEITAIYDVDDGLPPINGAAETITITEPDGTTIAASGFVTASGRSRRLGERMQTTLTVQLTGDHTVTPGA